MFGLSVLDIVVILLYFGVMVAIGVWASRRIKNKEDYLLGGRRFGKLIQTFAAFGQATSADNAVSTTTTTFNNGIAGIWSSMLYLFATPLYWVVTHWPRRMRIITTGDYFEERFNSKPMGAVYSIVGSIAMMAFIGLGMSAMTKTIVAIIPKPAAVFSEAEQAKYNEAYQEAVSKAELAGGEAGVLSYAELAERETLEAMAQEELNATEQARLVYLNDLKPADMVSYIPKNLLIWAVCIIVLLYAVVGGLEAAFVTDMIQGMFIILLSLILIPFGWAKINRIYGGEGMLDALQTIHLKLPDAFFKLFGAPQTPDFTWYYILSLSIMAAITVVVQPNGAVMAGSAKDEISNRVGTVVGNFLKRFCIIFWGIFGLAAIVLYQGKVIHSDLIWGHATRDLLGPLNLGLVGLMIACLLAALMSTVDCLMLTSTGLLTHNLYTPLVPNRSQNHYVWVSRGFGVLVIFGGALMALQFTSILEFLKFIWEINVFLAPAYWLGIKWRRANAKAAWASIVIGGMLFLVIPALGPRIAPSMKTNENLLVLNDPKPVEAREIAKEFDVERRRDEIQRWIALDSIGQAQGTQPEPLTQGQEYEHTYTFTKRAIFWSQGIAVGQDGQLAGKGLFSTELWIMDKLGFDLVNNPYALNETLRICFRTLLPFIIFIIVALLTRPDPKPVLDRFYAKMRTRVIPDPEVDAREVALSMADPNRFRENLVFPNSQFEIYRWNREDWVGFVLSVAGVGFVLVFIQVLVRIGAGS